ncbi:MAG: acyl-CoA dehydrogenase family protein [Sulfolobales archaeon]
MDFSISKDLEVLIGVVREFLSREVSPRYKDIELRGVMDRELFKKMAEQGILTPNISPGYGGPGLDYLTTVHIMREVGYHDPGMSLPVYIVVNNVWGKVIEMFAREEVREEVLPKICRGERFLGIASTEPQGGSDLVNFKTIAVKDGDGYVINGEKVYISGVREAREWGGGFFLIAKTSEERSHRAISAFYLPIESDGIQISLFETMGRKGISTGAIKMNNVRLSRRNLIGEEGRGFVYAMEGFMRARLLIGAAAIGSALRVLDDVISFVKSRTAFGWPLARYEAIQFKIAEIWAELEAVWNLVVKSAWIMDLYSEGKISRSEAYKYTSASKLLGVQKSFESIVELTQMLGAYGYTTESIAESALRGVYSYISGAEGAPNIMRMIIAREILGREYRPTPD